jgi:hypothetical protein
MVAGGSWSAGKRGLLEPTEWFRWLPRPLDVTSICAIKAARAVTSSSRPAIAPSSSAGTDALLEQEKIRQGFVQRV